MILVGQREARQIALYLRGYLAGQHETPPVSVLIAVMPARCDERAAGLIQGHGALDPVAELVQNLLDIVQKRINYRVAHA